MFRFLLVDDDAAVQLLFTQMLGEKFDVICVDNGKEGVEALKKYPEFHVIISDYEMPEMNGIEFLSKAKEIYPNSVRVLLSGKATLDVAIDAVNKCEVYRFLRKPCTAKQLKSVIRDSVEHHKVLAGAKYKEEKNTKNVRDFVEELCTLLRPVSANRKSRIMPLVRSLCRKLKDSKCSRTELAAHLSELGFIFLPQTLMDKVDNGESLSPQEYKAYTGHTRYSSRLISNFEDLEDVSLILSLQEADDLRGDADGGFSGDEFPVGAKILKAVSAYDRLKVGGRSTGDVISMLKRRSEVYDPYVLKKLIEVLGDEATFFEREVYPLGLEKGMVLAQDVFAIINGKKVKFLAKEQVLNETTIDYIQKHAERILDITEKILIKESLV